MPNGSLDDHLKKDRNRLLTDADRMTWKGSILKMMHEAALGVQYLHNSRYYDQNSESWKDCIIHRDLKPDNMLVTEDFSLKLTDFGEARAVDLSLTMTTVGTPIYISPEILRNDRYDFKVDVYSFAICLIAVCRVEDTVVRFFFEGLRKSMKKKDLRGIGVNILNNRMQNRGFRPKLHKSLYPSLRKLIEDCWQNFPSDRPTFDEIVKRLGGVIHDEVNTMDEPDFSIVHPENEAEVQENEELLERNMESNDGVLAKENTALKLKMKMLEELLAKMGNGGYTNIDEIKKEVTDLIALEDENHGTTTRIAVKPKEERESVDELKKDNNKGTIAVDGDKKKEVDGVANIMSDIASGGAKKPEPKKGLVGIDNIMASIGANGAKKP